MSEPQQDVDHRNVTTLLDQLAPEQLAPAWAVVRSLATACWWATIPLLLTVVAAGLDPEPHLVVEVATVSVALAALILEYHARAIGKRVRRGAQARRATT